jgi:hypothetical protein
MRTLGLNTRQIIKAGLAYFALVFGAGFMLGSVRVLFLVPRLGERIAELIETPFMFVVVLLSAMFIARRFALPAATSARLTAGILALGLLLAAEVLLVVTIQGRSLGEYIVSRDPVSGTVYLAMLVLFAVMPLIITRVKSARERHVA